MAFIYSFTFPNGKKYIGYTSVKYYKSRWATHKYHAKKGVKSKLYNAIRKHGWCNIKKEIIEEHQDNDHTLKILEPFYIEKYNTIKKGYNSIEGGGKGPSLKGKKNPTYKIRKGNPMKEWFTEEQCNRISKISSETHKGAKNFHARKYKIISPEGKEYIIHGELQKFCKEHKISFTKMYGLSVGCNTFSSISKKAVRKRNQEYFNTLNWSIFPLD